MTRWLRCFALCLVGSLPAIAGAEVVVEPSDWTVTQPLARHQTIEKLFEVTNQGKQPAKVLRIRTGDGFHVVLEHDVLPPGRTVPMKVSYQVPLGRFGYDTRIHTNVVLSLDTVPDSAVVNCDFTVRFESEPLPVAAPVEVQKGHYEPQPEDQPTTVEFFYDGGCGKCEGLMRIVITPLGKYFGSWVTINYHDVRNDGEIAKLASYKERYHVEGDADATTFVFTGSKALVGNDEIEVGLLDVIKAELHAPTAPPPPSVSTGQQYGPVRSGGDLASREVRRYSVLMMLAAGLADGFNPCAFATAVFLIAMLTRLGHDKRTLAGAGAAYAGAVFLTYFLIGLGLMRSLELFGSKALQSQVLNYLVATVALLFASMQILDVVRLRLGGSTRDLTMQMPLKLKQMSHGFLREGLARPMVAAGAATAGVLVTLVEAVCTGQLYVPTLIAVMKQPELRLLAVSLLFVYNLGFVLPLVIILVLAYRGITSESLAKVARRHLETSKLVLAGLLLVLATWLLVAPWLEHRAAAQAAAAFVSGPQH